MVLVLGARKKPRVNLRTEIKKKTTILATLVRVILLDKGEREGLDWRDSLPPWGFGNSRFDGFMKNLKNKKNNGVTRRTNQKAPRTYTDRVSLV